MNSKEYLLNALRFENKKFAKTIMSFIEEREILTSDDLLILTDRQHCRELFSSDYPMLLRISTMKSVSEQITDKKGRHRYYETTYTLNGEKYVMTSQLYGLGGEKSHKDNRTPFVNWIIQRINEDISSIEWIPSTDEYTPGISVEQWIELLNDETVFTKDYLALMKRMKDIGGQASCTQLANKYGGTKNLYNSGSSSLAERVYKKTKCNTNWPKDSIRSKWWPILYVAREAKPEEAGSFIYKLRDELSQALDRVDLSDIPLYYTEDEQEMTTKEQIDQIKSFIEYKGFTYDSKLIENFYLSLKSKPFVILAGTSGTGKTRLVRLFAEAIGAEYKLVSIRPDWSDSSDLFGHIDLNGKYNPGEILKFMADAQKTENADKPYILCLDEMNLARVEYYLSDFLSIIETRDVKDGIIISDPLINEEKYGTDASALEEYGIIRFPDNFYLVGTVNMDETTFPFSKKVLDRANTIEFNYVDLSYKYNDVDEVQPLIIQNDFLKTEYLYLSQCEDIDYIEKVSVELQNINEILKESNAHVGYRVRDEIIFYMLNNKNAQLLSDDEALDNEIMQKILPRIQGSSLSVKDMLCKLFIHFAGDFDSNPQNNDVSVKMENKLNADGSKYPKSAEKIAFMVRRFEEDGFTSYWL